MKNGNFKPVILCVLLLGVISIAAAQPSTTGFFQKSMQTQNTGMYVLGSWALLNITTGAYGWAQYEGQKMYFNQMNAFWNLVNISIVGAALYSKYHIDLLSLSDSEMLARHLHTEHILLLNAGLDAAYIGTGFLLKNLSVKYQKRENLLQGYGNSLLLQGGFLLVFDMVMYGILHLQQVNFFNQVNLSISKNMIGLQLHFVI